MTSDVHGALIHALLARGGSGCRLLDSAQRPWASATFEGARHVVELEVPAERTAGLIDGIEEAKFDLRRHLLADLAVMACAPAAESRARVRIEALTLLDR